MLLKVLLPAQWLCPYPTGPALLEASIGALHEYKLWKYLVNGIMSPWGRMLFGG